MEKVQEKKWKEGERRQRGNGRIFWTKDETMSKRYSQITSSFVMSRKEKKKLERNTKHSAAESSATLTVSQLIHGTIHMIHHL